mmetsp:Transcript_13398/g.25825  ORF Transcript_13398/g.25825 Transcript_13398/m.25825 type:complete len:209 (-) Transcript_13398:3358-3984(-)
MAGTTSFKRRFSAWVSRTSCESSSRRGIVGGERLVTSSRKSRSTRTTAGMSISSFMKLIHSAWPPQPDSTQSEGGSVAPTNAKALIPASRTVRALESESSAWGSRIRSRYAFAWAGIAETRSERAVTTRALLDIAGVPALRRLKLSRDGSFSFSTCGVAKPGVFAILIRLWFCGDGGVAGRSNWNFSSVLPRAPRVPRASGVLGLSTV